MTRGSGVGARGSLPLTAAERRLIARLRAPLAVQRYLNRLPYNQEPGGRATLRSFRGVVRHRCAHCLDTRAMTSDAGLATLRRPTPVAIHDDRDVARQAIPRDGRKQAFIATSLLNDLIKICEHVG